MPIYDFTTIQDRATFLLTLPRTARTGWLARWRQSSQTEADEIEKLTRQMWLDRQMQDGGKSRGG